MSSPPPGTLRNLLATGDAALAKKRYDAAERFYRMALVLKPFSIRAEAGLGTLSLKDGWADEALRHFKNALLFRPDFDKGLAGVAHARSMKEYFQEAEFWYRCALITSDSPREISIALGVTCLRNGKWKEGFERYDLREGRQSLINTIGPNRVWDGAASLTGKTIVVIGEQGLGDHINFARYCKLIKERGAAKVTFFTRPELKALFRWIPEIDAVVSDGETVDSADYTVMVMSLPLIFGTTPNNIPMTKGYITPPSQELNEYKSSIAATLRVAVAWQGNSTNSRDGFRSCSFENFSKLFTLTPHVTFLALPWDYQTVRKDAPSNLVSLNDGIKDFRDTALNLRDVDLIISVDTSLVHLAGAMNKPTWLLLGQQPDWRWLAKGTSGLWYDSVKLFRHAGSWVSLINSISKKLASEKETLLINRTIEKNRNLDNLPYTPYVE